MNKITNKTKKFTIDNSVFAKLFLQEQDSDKTTALFCYINENLCEIIAPELLKYELANVVKLKKLDFHYVFSIFKEQEALGMQILEVDDVTLQKAYQIAHKNNASIYDSIYHAMAILNNSVFITADKEHFDKTSHLGHIEFLQNIII